MTQETMLGIARQAIANAYKYDDDRDQALSWFDDAVKAQAELEQLTAENQRLAAENERLTAKSGKASAIPGSDRTPRA
jgi:cell division protein FtsB